MTFIFTIIVDIYDINILLLLHDNFATKKFVLADLAHKLEGIEVLTRSQSTGLGGSQVRGLSQPLCPCLNPGHGMSCAAGLLQLCLPQTPLPQFVSVHYEHQNLPFPTAHLQISNGKHHQCHNMGCACTII